VSEKYPSLLRGESSTPSVPFYVSSGTTLRQRQMHACCTAECRWWAVGSLHAINVHRSVARVLLLADVTSGTPWATCISALMDLYIYPLYVLVSKIFSSILNSSAPIHPLYHPLSTLSTVGPTYHFI
jgi:hypothetical protein